jgi:hypothetical protein
MEHDFQANLIAHELRYEHVGSTDETIAKASRRMWVLEKDARPEEYGGPASLD